MKHKVLKRSPYYGCFVRIGAEWHRVSPLGLPLNAARISFQSTLLALTMRGLEAEIRPATEWGEEPKNYYEKVWSVIRSGHAQFIKQDSLQSKR